MMFLKHCTLKPIMYVSVLQTFRYVFPKNIIADSFSDVIYVTMESLLWPFHAIVRSSSFTLSQNVYSMCSVPCYEHLHWRTAARYEKFYSGGPANLMISFTHCEVHKFYNTLQTL